MVNRLDAEKSGTLRQIAEFPELPDTAREGWVEAIAETHLSHNTYLEAYGRQTMQSFVISKKVTPRNSHRVVTAGMSWQNQPPVVRQVLRGPALQPKLTIGAPDDAYEREADSIADRVMRLSDAEVQASPAPPTVQRMCSECDEELRTKPESEGTNPAASVPPVVHDVLRSSGNPLDAATRAFFEPRFGHVFSHVRVHTDSRAAESARALDARAYTLRNRIAFAAGQYTPERSEGRKLLAHELMHVVQQRQSRATLLQLQPAPQLPLGPIGQSQADAADALRRAAERVKDAIGARDGIGIVPHDVDEALGRFFPGTTYESLEDLLARIEPMIGWIKDIPTRRIRTPVPAGTPHAHQHAFNIGKTPAFAISTPEFAPPHYIALYDDWEADPDLQATRLLHEAYHFSFPTIRGHNPNDPWTNPFAYQRFVSILGGLKFN